MYSPIHRKCFGEETPTLSFHELPRRTVSEMRGWCNSPRLPLCRARVSCITENWQAGIVAGTTQGLGTRSQDWVLPSSLCDPEPSFPPQASHLSDQLLIFISQAPGLCYPLGTCWWVGDRHSGPQQIRNAKCVLPGTERSAS